MMMTRTEARRQVASILHHVANRDFERAHSALDQLNVDVLTHVAAGHYGCAELAQIAVEANALDFPRWAA